MRTGLVLTGAAVFLLGAMYLGAARSDDQPATLNVAAPEFAKVTEWINSPPLKLADLKGKVVAVHFWTFG
jgi:hypothetical protein